MTTITAAFRPATLRLLEITYDCDLTRSNGDVIPFGVLGDLSVDDVYGLGLVARKTLTPAEEGKIGGLARADFAAPFTYLLGIFNEVFRSEKPLAAFADLVDRHTHSLRFRPLPDPTITLPRALVTASVDARRLWVKDELASHGNKAYWRMFPDHVPDAVDKAVEEEARELKAA
jgi:hypothetical protein